jgi:hypothetical protein
MNIMNTLIAANAELCFILWMHFEHVVVHVDWKVATSLVLGNPEKVINAHKIVAMLREILLIF